MIDLTAVYAKAGFSGHLPFGDRAAMLIVDVCRAYLDPASPLYAGVEAALDANVTLEAARLKAADMLKALISAIVLTPNDDGLEIDVQADLAGILAIASNAKSPRPEEQGLSQLKVVAGTRFHLNLRSRPSVVSAHSHDAMPSPALFPGLFATLA